MRRADEHPSPTTVTVTRTVEREARTRHVGDVYVVSSVVSAADNSDADSVAGCDVESMATCDAIWAATCAAICAAQSQPLSNCQASRKVHVSPRERSQFRLGANLAEHPSSVAAQTAAQMAAQMATQMVAEIAEELAMETATEVAEEMAAQLVMQRAVAVTPP